MSENIELIPVYKNNPISVIGQFSPEANKYRAELLAQLRSFEEGVCRTIRNIGKELTKEKIHQSTLEGKVEMLEDIFRHLNKDLVEKYNFLEADPALNVAQKKLNDGEKITFTPQTENDALAPLERSSFNLKSVTNPVLGLMRTTREAIKNAEEDIEKKKAHMKAPEINTLERNKRVRNGHNQLELDRRWSVELARAEVNVLNSPMQKYNTNQIYNCDRNYRIEGIVNGKIITCLLDTGAYMSLMGVETAKIFDIRTTKNPEIPGVLGVGNELVSAVGQCEIRFELAECQLPTDLLLVKNDIQKDYDMIIGRNTLCKLPLYLDFETGRLLNKRNFECLKLTNPNSSQKQSSALKEIPGFGPVKTDLEGHDFEKLAKCLIKNSDVFAKHDFDLGRCTLTAPTLITTTETPITCKPYRVPEKFQEKLDENLDKMIELGILKKSNTPWVSPIVIVQKTDENIRPCVNFNKLNEVTVPDPYPIPRMEKILHETAGWKYYSSLDLTSGFWQIPLDEATSYKCGIICERGVFEPKMLPFGLKNAPSIFQRIMDTVLECIKHIKNYIDDILVRCSDVDEHLMALDEVFARMRKYNLKLKPGKCEFLKLNIIFLGHQLSEKGYQPSISNIEIIINFPEPSSCKEVKRFLGLAGFFRKFIPIFAEMAAPLNKLLRGKDAEKQFAWGNCEREAFEALKKALTKYPSLRPPNYKSPFHVFTDASKVAYSGAILQISGDKFYAVSYCSKTLNETESRYPPCHGELAAIVHSLAVFHPIIYGCEITVHTDHKPLVFLMNKAPTSPKLNRWLMAIQDLNPKIVYIEGKNNVVADAISRVPIKGGIEWDKIISKRDPCLLTADIPYLLTADQEELIIKRETIERETKVDPILSKVLYQIRNGWPNCEDKNLEPFHQISEQLHIKTNIIWKGDQILMPENLKMPIIKWIHKAHFGVNKTKNKARQFVWWPKIGEDIESFIGRCEICQLSAPNPPKSDANHKWPPAKNAFDRVHADLAGPFMNSMFLLIIDSYSKFPFVYKLTSTTSGAIIKHFGEIFSMFGSCKVLVTDNGPQFTSAEFEYFLMGNAVKHLTSPAYHPSSNGEAERLVQTFKRSVQKIAQEYPLAEAIQIFLQEYRSNRHSQTGESPALLFLRRQIRTPLELIRTEPKAELGTPSPIAKPKFSAGDSIWARINFGRNPDMPNWAPGKIKNLLGDRMAEVELENGSKDLHLHVDQIRPRREKTRAAHPKAIFDPSQ